MLKKFISKLRKPQPQSVWPVPVIDWERHVADLQNQGFEVEKTRLSETVTLYKSIKDGRTISYVSIPDSEWDAHKDKDMRDWVSSSIEKIKNVRE